MLGNRELTLHDYAAILKRRSWLIASLRAVLLGAGSSSVILCLRSTFPGRRF